jgi:hypothetical protein
VKVIMHSCIIQIRDNSLFFQQLSSSEGILRAMELTVGQI